MSHDLEITVNGLDDEERIIVVTDWTYNQGRPMHMPGRNCETGCPAEQAEINDIECHWADTQKPLDGSEWDRYGDAIDDAVWNYVEEEAQASKDDWVDRDYDRIKDREVA